MTLLVVWGEDDQNVSYGDGGGSYFPRRGRRAVLFPWGGSISPYDPPPLTVVP